MNIMSLRPVIFVCVHLMILSTSFAADTSERGVLAWDSVFKEYNAETNELTAKFNFSVTNTSGKVVAIKELTSSCGCTTTELPEKPWILSPGADGKIEIKVDLRGKYGQLNKLVCVETSSGPEFLRLKILVPAPALPNVTENERKSNLTKAKADRQAVFKDSCVKCHLEPGIGKTGKALYIAVCAICHETPRRASMVPDLATDDLPGSTEYWQRVIRYGTPGTLMPAFAQDYGGPLTSEQLDSLVEYLSDRYSKSE